MVNRSVKTSQFGEMISMDGIPIRQPMPAAGMSRVDPFLLLHHFTGYVAADSRQREVGIGPHPHRGFSPVTFVIKGDVHHRDSRGNSAVVKAGGVQWMDAGMGIIHSERPSVEFAEKGGEQEIVQLWINSPAAHKMDQPNYQALNSEDIPKIVLPNNGGKIDVIAGTYENIKGPANAKSEIILLRIDLKPGASHTLQITEKYNLLVYVLSGSVIVGEYGSVSKLHLMQFNNDGDTVDIKTEQNAILIVLAGIPINEKIESYGPFVMNSQSQIMEAMRDYQMGKMGVLIEEF
jgi:quercetin 2,3-dioxygenase